MYNEAATNGKERQTKRQRTANEAATNGKRSGNERQMKRQRTENIGVGCGSSSLCCSGRKAIRRIGMRHGAAGHWLIGMNHVADRAADVEYGRQGGEDAPKCLRHQGRWRLEWKGKRVTPVTSDALNWIQENLPWRELLREQDCDPGDRCTSYKGCSRLYRNCGKPCAECAGDVG